MNLPGSTPPSQLRSAAWVIGLALLLPLLFAAWHLKTLMRSDRTPAVGDGRNVATYGFELSPCLIPCEEIVAAGLPRDGLLALLTPPLMTPQAVDSLNRAERGKYLVPADRVIGVLCGPRARAYPLRVLNWHEVVNDTLGGRSITVTFNPLCESSAVFDRRVAGEVLEFGVSGLLYNANLLMYDRRPGARGESLWSQLQARAVTGPAAAAGRELEVLPCVVMTWGAWRDWQPRTTVPFPAREFRQRYQRDPYGVYYGSEKLRFPVRPLPTEPWPGDTTVRYKARIVAVLVRGEWLVYPWQGLVARCSPDGEWRTRQGGVDLRFRCGAEPLQTVVTLGDTERLATTIHSFWFAWHAHRPRDEVVPLF